MVTTVTSGTHAAPDITRLINKSRIRLILSSDPVVSTLARTCGVTAATTAAPDAIVTPDAPVYHVSESRQDVTIDPRWITVLPEETRDTVLDSVLQTILMYAAETPEILEALVQQAVKNAQDPKKQQEQQAQPTPQQKGGEGGESSKNADGGNGGTGSEGASKSQGGQGGQRGSGGESYSTDSGGAQGQVFRVAAGAAGDDEESPYADDSGADLIRGMTLTQSQQQAIEYAMNGGRLAGVGASTVPTRLQKTRVTFETKAPIEALLGTLERKDDAEPTRMLPNRRFPGGCGWRPLHNPALLVALDISGSMSSDALKCAVGGVEKLMRDLPYRIDVVRFNSSVQGSPIDARTFLRAPFETGGGTSFAAVQEYTSNSRYEALILVTDGEDDMLPKGDKRLRRDVTTLAILVPGSSDAAREGIVKAGYKAIRMRG